MAVADAPSAAIDRLTENRQEISGHARDLRQLHQVEIVVVQLSGCDSRQRNSVTTSIGYYSAN